MKKNLPQHRFIAHHLDKAADLPPPNDAFYHYTRDCKP